jgi:hypothetical protein
MACACRLKRCYGEEIQLSTNIGNFRISKIAICVQNIAADKTPGTNAGLSMAEGIAILECV